MLEPATSDVQRAATRIAVGIATRGRPQVLRETLIQLQLQSRAPDKTIVCHTVAADIEGADSDDAILFVTAPSGLPRQRNRIMQAAADCDILLFIDDDFLASSRYVEATLAAFQADPTIAASTGSPIADDVKGPGLTVAQARTLIAADLEQRDPRAAVDIANAPHGYGCNMAIDLHIARRHGIAFDERLPLYAWSEDIDYTHRLGRHGRIVKLARARGVHLGVKQGRSPGRNLGYSQVANPLYLRGKGSYSWGRALRSVGRNIAANAMRSAWPEPWIDRRGRLLGNALAVADMLRGRMTPERILEL